MTLKDLDGKQIAILGYGVEGKAVARYLVKHGVTPVLFDRQSWDQWPDAEQEQIKKLRINFIFGPDCLKELRGFDIAFRSPGVPRHDPDILECERKGLIITSQTAWFFENCPAYIIGVTGTKGKGTTCSLLYSILTEAVQNKTIQRGSRHLNINRKVYLTGNIGMTAPLDFVDQLQRDDVVIFELSSFQLQDMAMSPGMAVVLMITEDHLDVHESAAEYVKSKQAIVKYQTSDDIAVINDDYEFSRSFAKLTPAAHYFFSRNHEVATGCFVRSDSFIARGIPELSQDQVILTTRELQLKGAHNWENVSAAACAALLAGALPQAVAEAVRSFKGLEHRLEFVAERGGIKFYNDSLSTIEETTISALQAFTEPEILILGGYDKKTNYEKLIAELIRRPNLKSIILVGQTASRLKQLLTAAGGFKGDVLEGAASMPQIMDQVRETAVSGDVVLLSPASASFDMFKNYADRGIQFKKEVEKW